MPEPKPLKLCECGCGKRVARLGNRFIQYHHPRGVPNPHTSSAHLAADKANSERQLGAPRTPEACAAIAAGKLGVSLSPEHCAAISACQIGVPKSPEACAAMKKGLEESGVFERMRGGNDICNHHYMYDHSDLSLNTVQMTRSDHQKLHKLLQKLGYIIPHINKEVL